MQAFFSITLAILCINIGTFFVGNLMGIDTLINASIDPADLNGEFQGQVDSLQPNEGGFNPLLTFGDYTKAIEFLEGIFAAGWIVNMIQLVCFDCPGLEYFTIPLQSVIFLLNVIAIIGLLRGINIV